MISTTAIVMGSLGAGFALFVYIFLFIFLSGPEARSKAYDKFVMEICSPNGDFAFIKTVFTFGYFKRSFKRFCQYYRLKLFPQPRAEVGKRAPDATVVTLDGEKRSLLKDFLLDAGDMPVILNMGSYT